MIKCENGEVSTEGTGLGLTVEVTQVIRCVYGAMCNGGIPKVIAKDLIAKAVELGFKSEDEIKNEAESILLKDLDVEDLSKMSDEELSRKKRELEVQMMMKLFK